MKAKMAVFLGAFAALALAFAPHAAKADLIYWMVSDAKDIYNNNASIDFRYATISVDGSDTPLHIYNDAGDTGYSRLYADGGVAGDSTNPAYAGSFVSDSVSSFKVQLYNDAGDLLGWQTYQKSDVLESIWAGETPIGSGATVLTVTEVVPEPSSGLMLLLGGALLALRRRRAAC